MSKDIQDQEWEYKVENWKPGWLQGDIEKRLNELGKDGWELIALQWWDEGSSATIVLKRPRS